MPRLKMHALTPAFVKRAATPGDHTDGYGLTLRVDARSNKRWIQRLTIRGKQRNLGLGTWPEVSLEEAREPGTGQLARGQGGTGSHSREARHQTGLRAHL